MNVPQFGEPQPGRAYPDRPAAFVVVERAGKVATVRVHLPGGVQRLDLPGGGIDAGESPQQAGARECGEEAGLVVEVGARLVAADHYFVNQKNEANNTRGQFFVGRLVGEDADLKTEDDHVLVWLDPLDALRALSREAHAWALAVWLRTRAP